MMIELQAFAALAGQSLGPFAPKPTSLTPGQVEASKTLWASADGRVKMGVWECTPGRFTADRTAAGEHCHILSGEAVLYNADGSGARRLGPGDQLVLPQGWTGEWEIVTPLRKLFLIVPEGI